MFIIEYAEVQESGHPITIDGEVIKSCYTENIWSERWPDLVNTN